MFEMNVADKNIPVTKYEYLLSENYNVISQNVFKMITKK